MSTLSVTTINTANSTTDLTLKTGNTSGPEIVLAANGSTSINNIDNLSIGNSSVNTAITSTGITQNGLNFRVPKNYIVNPGMRISQENGTSSGTTDAYYPVDQWRSAHSQDGTLTFQQVSSATPGGSENRIRMTVTSADTSIAAGQYAFLIQPIEGLRTADLQWGTANATDVVVRFGFKGPAGTYAVAIRNQDNNRSFVREFTISGGDANTDTLQTLTFPGDTSGTWDKDNTLSFQLTFTFATGSTYQTTADAWQAGNYIGTASTSNGIGTTSDVFEIFDVGMYADPDSTGLAPRFELPHYDDDLRECQRYFWRSGQGITDASYHYTNTASGSRKISTFSTPVPMRSRPSWTTIVAPTLTNMTAISIEFRGSDNQHGALSGTSSGAGNYRAYNGVFDFNARM